MPLPILTPWINGAHLPAGSRPVDQVDAPYTGEPVADVVQATDSDLDLEFLEAEALRLGLPRLAGNRAVLDTRLISRLVHGSDVSHSLEAVSERLGVTILARHSALGDALATAEVFVRLLELLGRRGISTLGELLTALERLRRP